MRAVTLPVLPWFPRDWLSSTARAVLTPAGRSAFRDLLDGMWLSGECRLPDNERLLQGLSGLTPGEWAEVRGDVLSMLPLVDGYRTHPRLTAEWEKAVGYKQACSAGGKAAAAKRWGGDKVAISQPLLPNRTLLAPSTTHLAPSPKTQEEAEETPSESCPQERTSLPEFAVIWNEIMSGSPIPTVRVWSKGRARSLKARLADEPDLAVWRVAMQHLAASSFHRGQNDRGWVADVDFLLQPSQAGKWLDLARGGPPVEADPEITPQLRRLMGGVS